MTSRDFAYWCQGFFEIGGESVKTLNEEQVLIIKNHLNMVFIHEIDPSMGGPKKQQELNEAHAGKKPGTIHIVYTGDEIKPEKPETDVVLPPAKPIWANRPPGPNGEIMRC